MGLTHYPGLLLGPSFIIIIVLLQPAFSLIFIHRHEILSNSRI